MKQLDSSVLDAVDLDVPKNLLLFSVVTPPQHGSIIRHGSDGSFHKRGDTYQQHQQHQVLDFTMSELTNGTSPPLKAGFTQN